LLGGELLHEPDKRHKNILRADQSLLLVIDVQERFRPHIPGFESLVSSICTLVQAARILQLPIVVSEQYAKGLGPTVSEIKSLQTDDSTGPLWASFEKNCFSALGCNGLKQHLELRGRKQIIVCGIETHVCVNQTVHDLLLAGYQPHVVVDALASRAEINKKIGLVKMLSSGALPATVEMVLFEMLVEAGTANFKQIQSLVK